MEHIEEIREVVNEYSRIEKAMAALMEETKSLNLKKQAIELDLAKNREAEKRLIDKIKRETGKAPDFYSIMQELNINQGGKS